jgi:hypothetical protein
MFLSESKLATPIIYIFAMLFYEIIAYENAIFIKKKNL